MVNLEVENGKATVKAYTTGVYLGSKIILKYGTEVILEDIFDFHPATSYENVIDIQDIDPKTLEVAVLTSGGKILVDWKPEPGEQKANSRSSQSSQTSGRNRQ